MSTILSKKLGQNMNTREVEEALKQSPPAINLINNYLTAELPSPAPQLSPSNHARQELQRLRAVYELRDLTKNILDKFSIQPQDRRFPDHSPQYKAIREIRFDYFERLSALKRKFIQLGLTPSLIDGLESCCNQVRSTINKSRDLNQELTTAPFIAMLENLHTSANNLSTSVEDSYLGTTQNMNTNTSSKIKMAPSTYLQALQYCRAIKIHLSNHDEKGLIETTINTCASFTYPAGNAIIKMTEQEIKDQLKHPGCESNETIHNLFHFFKYALKCAQTRNWNPLMDEILNTGPHSNSTNQRAPDSSDFLYDSDERKFPSP